MTSKEIAEQQAKKLKHDKAVAKAIEDLTAHRNSVRRQVEGK